MKETCDICKEEIKGDSYPVYDENYNKQYGLIQCGECLVNHTNSI